MKLHLSGPYSLHQTCAHSVHHTLFMAVAASAQGRPVARSSFLSCLVWHCTQTVADAGLISQCITTVRRCLPGGFQATTTLLLLLLLQHATTYTAIGVLCNQCCTPRCSNICLHHASTLHAAPILGSRTGAGGDDVPFTCTCVCSVFSH
jgi:hypothetical protein